MKNIFKKIRNRLVACVGLFFRLLPIKKNRIYFMSNDGNKYACNPRAIFEYCYKNHKNEFDFVYIVNNDELKSLLPKGIKTAKKNSLKEYYYYYTSKVLVNNFRFATKYKKRKNQYYIQTWHGSTIPYKKIEKDVEEVLSPSYVKKAKYDSKKIDCLIMGSTSCQKIFDNCFYCDNKTVVTGTPRTDKLINVDEELKKSTYKNLGLNENDYLVLYAPTFRDNLPIEACFLDNNKLAEAFKSVTDKNVKILYRFHPNLAEKVRNIKLPENSINTTDYFDIQDLIMIADMLITDFSSCAFDMMFAGKQSLIYANNVQEYIDDERGLYISLKELPFMLASTEDELCVNVKNLNKYEQEYQAKVKEFSIKMGSAENGNACEQIYNIIKEKTR